MMTMKKILFYLFALTLFVNCTSNEPDYNIHKVDDGNYIDVGTINDKGEYAITFNNGSSSARVIKRAQHISVSGTGYDSFNLFTLCDTGVVMNPFIVEHNGIGWCYAGINNQDTAWFCSATNAYDFIGIIPTDAVSVLEPSTKSVQVNNVEAFVVKEAIEDSPKEFLYSSATVHRADYSNGVSLNFKHGNAKVYFNFESDDANTKLLDFTKYTPGTPAVPGTPASTSALSEKRKMFDVMAEGESVGYPLTSQQETMGGYYTGQLGNFMNLDPNHGSLNYISNARMAELMPLVNAQFIYVDENGNDISNVDWVYGQDRKNKVFLKFAPGVNAADFIAGNDAFWTNLTPAEQAAMQNYHDSGCRLLRINQNANGDYFGWGESYGSYMNTTSRWLTILVPGTPSTPAVPASGIQGFLILAATSNLGNGTDAVISTFADSANALVSIGSATTYTVTSTTDRFYFDIPSTALTTKTASPSVLYSLPVKSVANQGFTLKFSYVYKGDSVYDVRAYIPANKCVWQEGKKYTYNIKIQGLGNGKADDTEADENDPVVPVSNPIQVVLVTVDDYTDGDSYDILINH